MRGQVVTALALLGDDGDEDRRHELLTDPEPRVALAAAEDLLRTAEVPLPGALVDHCARAYAADPHEPDRARWPAPHKLFTDRLMEDPEAALRALAGGVPLAFEIADQWRDREADVLPWALRDMEGEAWELFRLAQLTCSQPPDLRARVREHVLPYLAADGSALRAAAVTALAVWRVTGRTEDTVGPLARQAAEWTRFYSGTPYPLVTLTEMGLLPRFAVDPPRQAAEAPRRIFSDLMCGDALHPDYVVRDAVRNLLATARIVD
ncbi:hypothetical protein [Streptomyces soliscabiei]|uniref:hypothetical protein n=1 Tax=Streptomyces soliscabiei TaxID=588897 RepID=UPI0029BA7117|nr:hypothetical protein [Streptomyces sp. NY05-11A]MDX2678631.1 hypothetical protein [Streptomyces sp. NY05-11A]